MEQETPRRLPAEDLDREQYLDHSFDLVARVRAARERAQREMEAFGDVSEYEIRRIYGQRTDIDYSQPLKKEEAAKMQSDTHEPATDESSRQKRQKQDGNQSSLDFEDNQPKPEEPRCE